MPLLLDYYLFAEAANEAISPKYLFPLSRRRPIFFKIGEQKQISRKDYFLKIICFPVLADEIIAGNRWNFLAWGKKLKKYVKYVGEHIKISRKD